MNGNQPYAYFEDRLIERFTRYARICTTSDRHAAETPSTAGQWELARMLAEELRALGIDDVEITQHCYVIARITGDSSLTPIGFLAHLDTAQDVSGHDVQVVAEKYNGSIITLNNGIVLDPAREEGLAAQQGRTIIHTDGTTLLGADDKAGIAEIVTAVEYLIAHPEIVRPPLEIIFSPDEETGKGLPELPLEKLRARFCYTLDGGGAPEVEAECFNAYAARVLFAGHVIHPGAARGRLVNAAAMAAYFITLLPRTESPEATDGYYGYYCVTDLTGNHETAAADIIVRDFERTGMERRLAALTAFARATEAAFPGGIVTVTTKSSYYNMKEKIDSAPQVLDKLRAAAHTLGLEIKFRPVRGGTDGSRLTELGIPTPNIWTGGRNFHSRAEWVSVNDMCLAVRLVIELVRCWGRVEDGTDKPVAK